MRLSWVGEGVISSRFENERHFLGAARGERSVEVLEGLEAAVFKEINPRLKEIGGCYLERWNPCCERILGGCRLKRESRFLRG